jgi:hypothetical protein
MLEEIKMGRERKRNERHVRGGFGCADGQQCYGAVVGRMTGQGDSELTHSLTHSLTHFTGRQYDLRVAYSSVM